MKKLDRYEFIWKAIQVHGYKYDYRKVHYKGGKMKVCIICPDHGEFWQEATSHLQGHSCEKCYNENRSLKQIWDVKQFIEKAKIIYNDKYDYKKVKYNGALIKVCILCPIHGDFFKTPSKHLNGQGCQKCIKIGVKLKLEDFIKRSELVHGDKYDYYKVNYVNINTKVCIICKEHGEFYQTPHNHINFKQGCPICNESKLEKETAQLLDENHITYERQKHFKWLGRQSLDFYLPDYNIGIECQGRQHFEPVEYFGGEKEFNNIKMRDKNKYKLCVDNDVKLLYCNFNNRNNILLIKNIKND